MISRYYFYRVVNSETDKSCCGTIKTKSLRPDPWGAILKIKEDTSLRHKCDEECIDITNFNRV